MAELAEHTSPPRRPSLSEARWRDIERNLLENPINVGSFQPLNIAAVKKAEERWSRELKTWCHPAGYFESALVPLISQQGNLGLRVSADVLPLTPLPRLRPISGTFGLGTRLTPLLGRDLDVVVHVISGGVSTTSRETRVEVVDEAKKRLAEHETLVRQLYDLIEKEGSAQKIRLRKINVLPAWSHEYEDVKGIVIEAEIEGSADQRFSLWEAVCDKIANLEDTLPENAARFLSDDISFVVSRG